MGHKKTFSVIIMTITASISGYATAAETLSLESLKQQEIRTTLNLSTYKHYSKTSMSPDKIGSTSTDLSLNFKGALTDRFYVSGSLPYTISRDSKSYSSLTGTTTSSSSGVMRDISMGVQFKLSDNNDAPSLTASVKLDNAGENGTQTVDYALGAGYIFSSNQVFRTQARHQLLASYYIVGGEQPYTLRGNSFAVSYKGIYGKDRLKWVGGLGVNFIEADESTIAKLSSTSSLNIRTGFTYKLQKYTEIEAQIYANFHGDSKATTKSNNHIDYTSSSIGTGIMLTAAKRF